MGNDSKKEEEIGRPGPWGEGRFQKPGKPPGKSVITPPGTAPGPEGPVSTPVTRKDYEFPGEDDPDAGGDAG